MRKVPGSALQKMQTLRGKKCPDGKDLSRVRQASSQIDFAPGDFSDSHPSAQSSASADTHVHHRRASRIQDHHVYRQLDFESGPARVGSILRDRRLLADAGFSGVLEVPVLVEA
jgi:hypothetical protein